MARLTWLSAEYRRLSRSISTTSAVVISGLPSPASATPSPADRGDLVHHAGSSDNTRIPTVARLRHRLLLLKKHRLLLLKKHGLVRRSGDARQLAGASMNVGLDRKRWGACSITLNVARLVLSAKRSYCFIWRTLSGRERADPLGPTQPKVFGPTWWLSDIELQGIEQMTC